MQIKQGMQNARSTDTKGIVDNIPKWVVGAPEPKQLRGFNNDATGKLLCPVDLDWENPEYVPSISF